jgi:hypothetical protein
MSVSYGRGRSRRQKKLEAKPIRRVFGDEAIKMINVPTVAAKYNDQMNHVDRGDQLRSFSPKDFYYDDNLKADISVINIYLLLWA